jgi:hypothetical protein
MAFDEDDAVEAIRFVDTLEHGSGLLGLKSRKNEVTLSVSIDHEVHPAIAEIADAIEEYDGSVIHGKSI